MRISFLILLLALRLAASPETEVFDLHAAHVRTLRDQPGDLHIDAQGVTFQTKDAKTSIRIAMSDLREANVADPRSLRFETYEVQRWNPIVRRVYTFRADPSAPVGALARFLAARVHRPVVGHYPEGVQFKVAAWHRRGRGGTNGMLAIGVSSIQFVSANPADSRTWLYRDIETIGKPDPFRFRVTTNRETYVLELKEDLPDAAYQVAWNKIYGQSF
jgi:hypothetical protein